MAGLDLKGREPHQAPVDCPAQTLEFYTLKTLADLRV
jgi:hypothetical protein